MSLNVKNQTNFSSQLKLSNKNYDGFKSKKEEPNSIFNKKFNNGKIPFQISFLVKKFAENKNFDAIRNILDWKGIDKDQNMFQVLFDKKCFDEIGSLIYKHQKVDQWKITDDQFRIVIENEELELILFFLRRKECRIILTDSKIQKLVLEKYIRFGSKIYYGAEILSYLNKHQWDNGLTG